MTIIYIIFSTSKSAVILSFLYKLTHIIRRKFMSRIRFLLAFCSFIEFYRSAFSALAGLFLMDYVSSFSVLMNKYNDFGYGTLFFGCFEKFFNVLMVFCVFVLGFKLMKFKGKLVESRRKNGVLKSFKLVGCKWCNDEFNGVKKKSSFGSLNNDIFRVCREQMYRENKEVMRVFRDGNEVEFEEFGDEDKMFDVMSLRKMVKVERRKANAAQSELEKERMAASSSVDETMAMILRLQNEKSVLQMRVNQLERVSEEKECHDQEVIESLEWIVMKHECERRLLEDQLRFCREKIRAFIKDDEWDEFDNACPIPSASHSSFRTLENEGLIRALEFDSADMYVSDTNIVI